MGTPFHYERAEVEATIDRTIAAITARIQSGDDAPTKKALEIASLHLSRAMGLFVFEAKSIGAEHEHVADMAGFAIANIINSVCQNYPCGCMQGRILAQIALNLPAMRKQPPSVAARVSPVEGGRA